jgi:NAD(P) transhydrogenase subunit alpha
MHIGVPKERLPGEQRIALVPESAARLVKAGHAVTVESGAGELAHFRDAAFADAGATIAPTFADAVASADVVVKVQRPSADEAETLPAGGTLIALLQPASSGELLARLGERGVYALALERVPRITRAQSMDVLSSQSTVAGYKAVLIGASALGKFLPMLTTAAGNIAPARVFVIGAGVAGLMAIATARRLGGVVSAFDVREAAREQVASLGASFVGAELVSAAAQDAGGYAREQAEDQQRRIQAAVGAHAKDVDLIVTTAQIPGRRAPTMITDEVLAAMRPGSVIIDLAGETGGNCESTRPGESVIAHGVTIMAPLNIAATVPMHASQMLSRNIVTLLQHLTKDGALHIDPSDEITGAMLVARPAAPATVS